MQPAEQHGLLLAVNNPLDNNPTLTTVFSVHCGLAGPFGAAVFAESAVGAAGKTTFRKATGILTTIRNKTERVLAI